MYTFMCVYVIVLFITYTIQTVRNVIIETCAWCISSALPMESAVLHIHIEGLFSVRHLIVLEFRKVSSRENINTVASLWNLAGSSTALLQRRLPNFRAIGKSYKKSSDKTSWIGLSSFKNRLITWFTTYVWLTKFRSNIPKTCVL